ncbi:cell division protein ZapE [Polynucleobacter sp. 30F-ANTBAC]|jgi:cell division protein ZapE|uniref:cell division protein ZapE n=1 Tax=Polynucleobacter sp. 30F-ANTBAC TaxID=2689095 RepID=UPI001C0CB218|nr:cell division protein ZapE [Polynucleobacter sp. 30F-ANTBAC]MBU3600696.1 cell division protein ZapE [Polynucleobacter sp. 30F-ANTBAC]
MKVTEFYKQELVKRGYGSDAAQNAAIDRLQLCQDQWLSYKEVRSGKLAKMMRFPELPRGVYMWGGVGRGKSFLMDCFYEASPVEKKTRLHFHEFMREVHRELQDLRGKADPLDILGKNIAKKYRLICFDEFHVSDVADAMILYKLLDALFKNRVQFVMTSNYRPDLLYPDGLHRDRILPAIALLQEKLDVMNVDAGIDYRQKAMEQVQAYYTPLGPETDAIMGNVFNTVAEAHDAEDPTLHIEAREIKAIRRAGGVAWFDFKTMCGGPRSQNDYLEISQLFHTVLLSDVPYMPPKFASEARRFTWLIDVFYDHKVKLIISAEVEPEMLYTEGPMANEFHRTVSRIVEMQSKEYLDAPRRIVDTRLT